MIKFLKRLFCQHERTWEFYPTRVYYHSELRTHGLKIVVCLDCEKIIAIKDYAE